MPYCRAVRVSYASEASFRDYEGFIKLRLAHGHAGSVLFPDQLFIKIGHWRFFQASFFLACWIGFNVEPDLHYGMFEIDVAKPLGEGAARLLITIRSSDHVKPYDDGSQFYSCQVKTQEVLGHFSAGDCQRMPNGDFSLKLHHHTTAIAHAKIEASGELWSSSWNLQGTRKLHNVAYVYLTSVRKIRNSEDLNRIAMASSGTIAFQTTSSRPVEDVLELPVYRESTKGRTHAIALIVPSALISPPHLLFHPQVTSDPAYYEVVCPEIFRVGLHPGGVLSIRRGKALLNVAALKQFRYVVVGNASELAGLAAPFDEEETREVMLLEPLDAATDLFTFWSKNRNTDQVTGKRFEPRQLL